MANILNNVDGWTNASEIDLMAWNPATKKYEDTLFQGNTGMRYVGDYAPGDTLTGLFLIGYAGQTEPSDIRVTFEEQDAGLIFDEAVPANVQTLLTWPAARGTLTIHDSAAAYPFYPMAFVWVPTAPPSDDHWLRIRYSDDGGHNLSNWRQESIGKVGEYGTRIVFDRLGQFRQRTITCSSPRKRDFLGVVGTIKSG